jgi:glycosyltransferase involved in cell wall biosynthesis
VTVAGFRDRELGEQDGFLPFVPRARCHLVAEPPVLGLGEFIRLRYLPRWCLAYFSHALQAQVDRLVRSGEFHRVHVSHSYMAFYLLDYVGDIPCVIDHHNVKSRFFQNAFEATRSRREKIAYLAEKRRWLRYEKEVIPLFDVHIACSEDERRTLREMTGKTVHLLPSGVDTVGFSKKTEPLTGANLLFTGSLDYFPNAQALAHFCKNCLPAIRAAVPGVTLQVVGKNPDLRVERLLQRTASVWYSYNVRDIRPFYYQSTAFVVPLLTGAGTRLKILEAMAVGLPVVSTAKGCEGLGLGPAEGVLIENDPHSMAATIIRLLRDSQYREAMGQAAFAACHARFSWDRLLSAAEPAIFAG